MFRWLAAHELHNCIQQRHLALSPLGWSRKPTRETGRVDSNAATNLADRWRDVSGFRLEFEGSESVWDTLRIERRRAIGQLKM